MRRAHAEEFAYAALVAVLQELCGIFKLKVKQQQYSRGFLVDKKLPLYFQLCQVF